MMSRVALITGASSGIGAATALALAASGPEVLETWRPRLPADWTVTGPVTLPGCEVDHVVVGPNGVFTVVVESAAVPATIGADGIYRHGARVTAPVKRVSPPKFQPAHWFRFSLMLR